MVLTHLQIKDFQVLYENKFGIILTKEEAVEQAKKLIALLSPILLPDVEIILKN